MSQDVEIFSLQCLQILSSVLEMQQEHIKLFTGDKCDRDVQI